LRCKTEAGLFAWRLAEGGYDILFRQGSALEEVDVGGVPAHEQLPRLASYR
jgi:hypothetical protein